ncbi:mutator type transposase [Tanacetum coccineum]
MVKLSFTLNVCKESSDTDEAAQYGGNPKSLTFEIHHDGCFTPTPSRSYVGGQVSSVDVVDIDELCLHDLKEMVVKLGFGVAGLMYYYFLRYLNVDAGMLEMAKFVKDNKIILVYVEHRSSNPTSSVEGPIVEETGDPFDGLDEILGDYANTREDITGKQMIVHVGNNSTVENVLDYDMLFETERVGRMRFQRSGEDFYYDPKHDEVFDDDDEHILEDVPEHDLDVIDYDSFGSDLDDGIDFEIRIQLRKLRRIGKEKKPRFHSDHVMKTLATNPDIPVRAVQDQMQKQFDVGVSKMKAFRAKRIASDKITSSFKEHYSMLREYVQELINQNPGTTVRIDVQQEPNPDSLTRTFRRVYVCLESLKQGFRACGIEILELDGCFMSSPFPGQILIAVSVDANNEIYSVAYAIVEAECKAKAIASVFPSYEHRATTVVEFNKKMGQLKSYNSAAYDWLMKIPAEQGSRSYFPGKAKLLTLAAAVVLGVNKQVTTVAVTLAPSLPPVNLPVTAKWHDMSAFVYFVITNAIVCAYTALSLFLTLLATKGGKKNVSLMVTILDLIMVVLLFSAIGATCAVGFIGYEGNSHVQWQKVCNVFDKFCHQVSTAMVLSFIGSIAYLLLIVFALINVHKRL